MRENPSSKAMRSFLRPLMPAVDLKGPEDWRVAANAAMETGHSVVEVLLRSEHALNSVALMKTHYPDLRVGVGTILSRSDAVRARDAGADFLVSPGTTRNLLEFFAAESVPYLPGVTTPSDIMQAAEFGFLVQKIFPAAALGAAYIRTLKGPFPWLCAVLSGGIDAGNVEAFTGLPLVAAISGGWLLPSS